MKRSTILTLGAVAAVVAIGAVAIPAIAGGPVRQLRTMARWAWGRCRTAGAVAAASPTIR